MGSRALGWEHVDESAGIEMLMALFLLIHFQKNFFLLCTLFFVFAHKITSHLVHFCLFATEVELLFL